MLIFIMRLLPAPNASSRISFPLSRENFGIARGIDIAARQGNERRPARRHLAREDHRERRRAAGFDDPVQLFERDAPRVSTLLHRHRAPPPAPPLPHPQARPETPREGTEWARQGSNR